MCSLYITIMCQDCTQLEGPKQLFFLFFSFLFNLFFPYVKRIKNPKDEPTSREGGVPLNMSHQHVIGTNEEEKPNAKNTPNNQPRTTSNHHQGQPPSHHFNQATPKTLPRRGTNLLTVEHPIPLKYQIITSTRTSLVPPPSNMILDLEQSLQ